MAIGGGQVYYCRWSVELIYLIPGLTQKIGFLFVVDHHQTFISHSVYFEFVKSVQVFNFVPVLDRKASCCFLDDNDGAGSQEDKQVSTE